MGESSGSLVGRVAEIRRYPVKSMGGERLAAVGVDALGIAGDRRFAVRDVGSGKVVSAKQPKLAALLGCAASLEEGRLVVTTADGRRFSPADRADRADRADLDAALSELLGREVRLEAAAGSPEREGDVYESYWPPLDGMTLSDVTLDLPVGLGTGAGTFVDLAALHVLTTASLARLRSLAPGSEITADRFRPGIVIAGGTDGGFAENDWTGRTATIGSATVTFSMASPRCVMTTVAQGSLPRDPTVLQTLARHNRLELDGVGAFPCLGAYAEVTGPGTVAVGDEVVLH